MPPTFSRRASGNPRTNAAQLGGLDLGMGGGGGTTAKPDGDDPQAWMADTPARIPDYEITPGDDLVRWNTPDRTVKPDTRIKCDPCPCLIKADAFSQTLTGQIAA